jgi:hypothetical protein
VLELEDFELLEELLDALAEKLEAELLVDLEAELLDP